MIRPVTAATPARRIYYLFEALDKGPRPHRVLIVANDSITANDILHAEMDGAWVLAATFSRQPIGHNEYLLDSTDYDCQDAL